MGNGHGLSKKVIKLCKKSPVSKSLPYDSKAVVSRGKSRLTCLSQVANSTPISGPSAETVDSSNMLTVLDTIGVSSLVVDNSGTVLAGNFEFAELSGRAIDAVRGMPIMDLLKSVSIGEPEWFEQADRSTCRCIRPVDGNGSEGTVAVSCVRFGQSGTSSNLVLCMIRRQQGPQQLQETLQRTARRLCDCQAELQRKNIAINEMLSALEVERKRIKADVRANLEQTIIPIVNNLKRQASAEQLLYLEGLEELVKDIASPFAQTLSETSLNLTPREIEVCALIRQGMSSKQMAAHLCTSEETVRAQRKSIRKKLGISNKKNISLRLALESL